jgi:hypothetical protein
MLTLFVQLYHWTSGARIGYALANLATIDQLAKLQSWANGSVSVKLGNLQNQYKFFFLLGNQFLKRHHSLLKIPNLLMGFKSPA